MGQPNLNDPFLVLFESNPMPMWIFEADTLQFLAVNDAAIKHYGYSREEFLRMNLRNIRPPTDVPTLEEVMANLPEGRVPHPVGEWRHLRRDGSMIFVEICSSSVVWNGRKARLSMLTDITQRKMTESALRSSETLLNEAQHVAGLGSWECWGHGHSTYSDEMYRIFGFPLQGRKMNLQDVISAVHPEDRPRMKELLECIEVTPHEFDTMFRVLKPNCEVRHIHARGEIVCDSTGKPMKMTGTVQDMTERVEAEDIRLRNARLQAANKELEAFSYSVSHDLRTPLRSIDAFGKLLEEEYGAQLDETGRGYLDLILSGTRRMNELIDDLIEFSRVTGTSLEHMEVELSAVVENIARTIERTAPERHVEWRITPGLKASADPRLMRIVLENLLGNAWKFTGKSEKARIEFGAMQQGNQTVYFVRDNGAGFDMEFYAKLFGVFQRLHSEREFSGTGIGLAIVQRIIARHGGRIWAEGAVGKGATFYFTLPA